MGDFNAASHLDWPAWPYFSSGTQTAPATGITSGSPAGTWNGYTWPLAAGSYIACYLKNNGYTPYTSCVSFSIGSASPTFSLDKSSYSSGEQIGVIYANGLASTKDWFGMYLVADGTPNGSPATRFWCYHSGTHTAPSTGTVTFKDSNCAGTSSWSPSAGSYKMYWLKNDGYTQYAANITLPAVSIYLIEIYGLRIRILIETGNGPRG